MVAARNPDVAVLVLMAGPGVPGDGILAAQTLLISEAGGLSHEAAEKDAAKEREVLAIVKTETDATAIKKTLREKLAGTMPEAQLGAEIGPGAKERQVSGAGSQRGQGFGGFTHAEFTGHPKSSRSGWRYEFRSG